MITSRVKTCCTKCGDPIGNKIMMTTDYKTVISKKPIFCDDWFEVAASKSASSK